MSDRRIWLTKFHSDWQNINISAAYFIVRTDKIFKISWNDWHVQKDFNISEINQGVFVKHYAPGNNKVLKAICSFKVKVEVIRSLTLVSFERASLVEYACQIEVPISYSSKVIAKVKVDNRQTNKQIDKQTGQKQYAPDH